MKSLFILLVAAIAEAQVFPKTKKSTFNAILPSATGASWSLSGSFTMTTQASGATPSLMIELDLFPASTDVSAVNNIYQHYIQFNNWDPASTLVVPSYNNVVSSYYLSGATSKWVANPYPL